MDDSLPVQLTFQINTKRFRSILDGSGMIKVLGICTGQSEKIRAVTNVSTTAFLGNNPRNRNPKGVQRNYF